MSQKKLLKLAPVCFRGNLHKKTILSLWVPVPSSWVKLTRRLTFDLTLG